MQMSTSLQVSWVFLSKLYTKFSYCSLSCAWLSYDTLSNLLPQNPAQWNGSQHGHGHLNAVNSWVHTVVFINVNVIAQVSGKLGISCLQLIIIISHLIRKSYKMWNLFFREELFYTSISSTEWPSVPYMNIIRIQTLRDKLHDLDMR